MIIKVAPWIQPDRSFYSPGSSIAMKFGNIFNIFRWRERRGERVESTEANVYIDDTAHPVMDWSESGFRIQNYPDSPAAGERFAFRFELPLTSEDVFEFEAWAEVVENADRGLAVRYLHLDEAIADRIHEVLRVLSIMDPTVPKGAITYD